MNIFAENINRGLLLIKILVIVPSVFLILLAMTASGHAHGVANARATAMAGAYTSLAQGYYCPSFNPANLGLAAYQKKGMQIFGFGLSVRNNSFSLDEYNKYTGARLNESDKQELLSKIPAEGLKVSGDAEINAIGVGWSNFVVSLSGMGAAEVNLGRTAMELLLNGNAFAETIDLSDVYGQGYGLAALNFSYGHRLYKNSDRQLSVGATFRFLKGYGYEEVTEANGHAVTLATGFEGAGNLVIRSATGGTGYAIDLGTTLQINRDYTVGATFFNFLSGIKWTGETEEHRYTFAFDTLTAVNMDEDSLFTSTDTTVAIGSFSSSLPAVIKVGLAKTRGSLLWAVDWEQGFRKAAGSSTTPRISTGAEYRLLDFLPIRAGFGLGGKQGTTFAGGFGIQASIFHVDIAAANYNAVIGSSGKGINFAVNGGIRF
jgi:hypothetical protein